MQSCNFWERFELIISSFVRNSQLVDFLDFLLSVGKEVSSNGRGLFPFPTPFKKFPVCKLPLITNGGMFCIYWK